MSFKHRNNWNEKKLKQLVDKGKIRGYVIRHRSRHRKNKKIAIQGKVSNELRLMHYNIHYWCSKNALHLVTEHKFHPDRGWRFDFAIPALKIAIEYEGILSEKSRHTTAKGYTGDAEKYNAAQKLGWKVLRYTALNYKQVLTDLSAYVH